jgi:hypothetical protein
MATIPPIPNPSSVNIPATSPLGAIPSQYSKISEAKAKANAARAKAKAAIAKVKAAKAKAEAARAKAAETLAKAKAAREKLKSTIKDIKGKYDNNNIFKQVEQPEDFLKSQKDDLVDKLKTSFNKEQIVNLLLPVLRRFIRVEFITRLLIKKLEKQTREQVKNKGTLVVQNGTFTFTPSDNNNYTIFKNNFDKKVSNIKKALDTIQRIITLLNNVIRILNISLSIIQLYIKIKLIRRNSQLATAVADLANPSPAKTSGPVIADIIISMAKLEDAQGKVEKFQTVIISAQLFLGLFKTALNDLQSQINKLKFIIITDPTDPNKTSTNLYSNSTDLNDSIITLQNTAPEDEEYIDAVGKSYTLELVTLPNGAIQYQALDSYSKFKITQTAPSKIKTAQQLLEEIKQILG